MNIRIGSGFDIHRIGEKGVYQNPFILGGIEVSNLLSVDAHSDGDTLLHALIDAILGALGKEDIGDYFPNTEKKNKGVNSFSLLSQVLSFSNYETKWEIGNIDFTIVLESPKLGEKKKAIKNKLNKVLGINEEQITIKAKTFEDPSKKNEVWVYCTLLIHIK